MVIAAVAVAWLPAPSVTTTATEALPAGSALRSSVNWPPAPGSTGCSAPPFTRTAIETMSASTPVTAKTAADGIVEVDRRQRRGVPSASALVSAALLLIVTRSRFGPVAACVGQA